MGEYADYLIDEMMDADFSPFTGREPKKKGGKPPAKFYNNRKRGFDSQGKLVKEQHKPKPRRSKEEERVHAREYPGAHTPAHLLRDYPEELFDLGSFPKGKPRDIPSHELTPKRVLRPALPEPGPLWEDLANSGDAPF